MRYSKTILTTVFVALVFSVTGCGDAFFTRPPQDQLTADNFYNSEQDLRRATGALYNQPWFGWNGTVASNMIVKQAGNTWHVGSETADQFINLSVTAENSALSSAWGSLFAVVNQSNLVIQNVRNQARGNLPDEAVNQAIAEARFMRGYAYTYLAQLWGGVPLITNTPDLIDEPEIRRNTRADVLQFAINDFEYAAEHLPRTVDELEQSGRLTQWSAKGMLARTHWTRATLLGEMNSEDLTAARNYAQQVIERSSMSLREDFGDLFIFQQEETNEQTESLFSLQWTYSGDTWGTQNDLQAFWAPEAAISGGAGWGDGMGAQGWVIESFGVRTNPDSSHDFPEYMDGDFGDERRQESFMMIGDQYPELLPNGYTYTRDGVYTGNATAMKKYVIGPASVNDGQVAQQRNGMDTYMLRLAEVYLTYAQAAVAQGDAGAGSRAEEYYNRVRTRAGLPTSSDGLTRDEVFFEKWRELVYEAQTWFMLQRWHGYQPEAAKQFIRDQRRDYDVNYNANDEIYVYEPDDWEPLQVNDAPNDRNANVFLLPFPEQDVVQNELLTEDPVEYDFSNQGSGSSE